MVASTGRYPTVVRLMKYPQCHFLGLAMSQQVTTLLIKRWTWYPLKEDLRRRLSASDERFVGGLVYCFASDEWFVGGLVYCFASDKWFVGGLVYCFPLTSGLWVA